MLIDSHCHLTHEFYENNLEELIKDSIELGISNFITIGTSVLENQKVIQVSENYENVFCTVGIYPHENQELTFDILKKSLEENINSSKKIVGIGECGIDITNRDSQRKLEDQKSLFEMQLSLAVKYGIPVTVHNRNGDEIILNILKKYSSNNLRGVIHCFDSNWSFAKNVLDLGFYISFSNMVTYPKKDALLEVVKNVPKDRFLIETDSPYLPPQSMRGEINYPKYVKIVAEKVAQIKQKTFNEVSELSYKNTCSLFKICCQNS